MVRFLESNGYDVSYFSGIDTDRRGAELTEHEVFMSGGPRRVLVGHSSGPTSRPPAPRA